MIVDGLLLLLWAVAGAIAAIPQERWAWAGVPMAAGAFGALARRFDWKWLLLPRRADGWAAFAAGWAGTIGYLAATSEWREVLFPAVAVAAAGLFLFHDRSALQSHAIVTTAVLATALGATLDPGARQLPLFFPFLVLLVLCVALVQQEYILGRLRDAARHGNLLAQQIPGYGGARRGLAPAIAMVTVTTVVATLVLYVAVPRFRFKTQDPRSGRDERGGRQQSGVTERMSLRGVQDLKMDYRVALRMRLLQDGTPFRPSLPTRLRSSAVDRMDGPDWVSTAPWSNLIDGSDGRMDGWITIGSGTATQPLEQEFEIEPADVPMLFAIPEVSRVRATALRIDGNGAIALTHIPRTRTAYSVVSDISGVDPRLYEREPRHPDPRYTHMLFRDPRIRDLARSITFNATSAWKKAAMIEEYLRSHYEYSLDFDPGDREPVASFLFHTRSGFCVHFAAAMAVLLRHLDIPCRIAQGFSGGEWSDRESLTLFRLSDSHAWVEVWLGSMAGWIPFDPTPAMTGSEEDPGDFAAGTPDAPRPDVRRPGQPANPLSADKLSKLDLRAQGQLISSFWNSVAAFWKSRAGKLLLFALVLASSVCFTWRALPRHEKSRLRALLLGSPGASTPFYDEFLTLAARAGLRPERGETPFEFGKRVERVYPGARKVSLALYAVRFGEAPLAEEEEKARPVIDGMRAAQAGRRAAK
ncbi:MAG: transglutaminase domain-containing protein [Planctomycetes bacterium]|nr:transglutaminase domain-containing protein [Planctomycetota bacterium]